MQEIVKEITHEAPLCDKEGRLHQEAVGWARLPLHLCNLRGRFPRKKKWNYWCITSDRFLFSATIAHLDYLSLGTACFLEYETKRFAECSAVKAGPCGPAMPETVDGSVRFERGRTRLNFERAGSTLHMLVRTNSFAGKPLEASIDINHPADHESLNVVVPWNAGTFQFTSKQHCLPAQGTVVWGNETWTFAPGTAFACLDFGRGIWPYRTAWNWASFSARVGHDTVGINMGAKWTDNTGMNENGILLNGRLHKIFEDVVFDYDDRDFMRPWEMKSETTDTVRLRFTPFYDKVTDINLCAIRTKGHQLFGHYSGTLQVDGRTVRINGIPGWSEEHRARW